MLGLHYFGFDNRNYGWVLAPRRQSKPEVTRVDGEQFAVGGHSGPEEQRWRFFDFDPNGDRREDSPSGIDSQDHESAVGKPLTIDQEERLGPHNDQTRWCLEAGADFWKHRSAEHPLRSFDAYPLTFGREAFGKVHKHWFSCQSRSGHQEKESEGKLKKRLHGYFLHAVSGEFPSEVHRILRRDLFLHPPYMKESTIPRISAPLSCSLGEKLS